MGERTIPRLGFTGHRGKKVVLDLQPTDSNLSLYFAKHTEENKPLSALLS